MAESLINRPKHFFALGVAVLAMCMGLLAVSPSKSDAFTTTIYCDGVNLTSYNFCQGAGRQAYALWGYGENHSVCVYTGSTYVCSGGPNQGVYDALGSQYYIVPSIQNNAEGLNKVHGRVYTN